MDSNRDKSSSSSPSPLSVGSASNAIGFNRTNPFSIDYILSSAAAVANLNQSNSKAGQERASPSNHPKPTNNYNPRQQQQPTVDMNQQNVQQIMNILGQQQQFRNNDQLMAEFIRRRAEQQHISPNVLYLMTCMLLRQQQQQQQQQQAMQSGETAGAVNPIDSLTLLANLTGQKTASTQAALSAPQDLAKQQSLFNNIKNFSANFQQSANIAQANFLSNQHSLIASQQQTHTIRHSPLMRNNPLLINNNNLSEGRQATHLKQKNNLKSINPPTSHHLQATHNSPTGYACHNSVTNNQQQFKLDSPTTSSAETTSSNNQRSANSHADKPPHSYIGLIGMCILSSPEKRMLLSNIYESILREYPYYRNRNSGWRNSVRHNLSLNECFQKSDRSPTGKGHYWTIHPANMEDFMRGDFRRRRAQRKVRRWNNMDVPSDESDDESIDVNKPPLPDYFKQAMDQHRRMDQATFENRPAMAAAARSGQLASSVAGVNTTSQQQYNQSNAGPLNNLIGSAQGSYLVQGSRSPAPMFILDHQRHEQQLHSDILMNRLNL